MSEGPPRRRSVFLGVASIVVVLVLGVPVVLHVALVQERVKAVAISWLEARTDLRIRVASLRYNLFRLTATAEGVSVSARHAPNEPFFEAASVEVTIAMTAFRGQLALDRIEIVGGRFAMRRTVMGSNLPVAASSSNLEPGALRLGRVRAALALDVRDEVAGVVIAIPQLTIDTAPQGGSLAASVGQIQLLGRTVRLSGLTGGLQFDGRTVGLSNLDVRTDVADFRLSGMVPVMTSVPSLDLTFEGRAPAARLVGLVTASTVVDGEVAFSGSVTGPMASPVATARVTGPRLVRGLLTVRDVDIAVRVDAEAVELERATLGLAGGRVTAAGRLAFEGTQVRGDARWAGVELGDLLAAAFDRPSTLMPAGTMSGSVSTRGEGLDVARWRTRATTRVAKGDSRRHRLAVPGQAELIVADRRWQFEASHRPGDLADARVSLRGRIGANGSLPVDGAIDVSEVELGALGTLLGVTVDVEFPRWLVREGRATTAATVTGTLGELQLVGTSLIGSVRGDGVALGATRVEFEMTLPSASVRLEAYADSVSVANQRMAAVNVVATVDDRGAALEQLTATAAPGGTMRASGSYGWSRRDYVLAGELAGWPLDGVSDVPVRGVLAGTFDGRGTIDRLGGDLRATLRDAVYDTVNLGTVTAQASLDGREAVFEAQAPLLGTSAHGRVDLDARRQSTIDVAARSLDLARLQALVPQSPVPLRGTVSAAAHLEGPLSAPPDMSVTLQVDAVDLWVGDLPVVLNGASLVTYRDGVIQTPRLGLVARGLQATVNGSLPVSGTGGGDGALTMTLIGDVAEAIAAARASGLVDVPAVTGEGPIAVIGRVDGSMRVPKISADIDVGPATAQWAGLPTIERIRLLGRVFDDRATVEDFFAVVDGAEVTGSGSAPLAWVRPRTPDSANAPGTLQARLRGVTTALISRVAAGVPTPEVDGVVDATIALSSASPTLAGLTGEVRLDRLEALLSGVAVTQGVPTRLEARAGIVNVAAWEWRGGGSALSLEGWVRLSDLETGVRANGEIDLRLLSPFLRATGVTTAGRLVPRLAVSGPITRPFVNGDVTLVDAEVRIGTPRVLISGLNGRADFSRDRLQMTAVRGSVNGGELTLGGQASFARGMPATAALTAEVRGMTLDYPRGLRTELNGELAFDVGGEDDLSKIPLVSGTLRVVRGAYRQPLTVVGGLLAALQSRSGPAPNSVTSTPAALAAPSLVLDLSLTTEEDIIIDNNAATLALDADVRLIGSAALPALSGRAEIREGGRVLLGRNTYQVRSGTLDFSNPSRIDPELNVQLFTRAGGVSIDVTLGGTASTPTLELSSEDSELSQSDLTARLLTGRPLEDLGSADAALVGNVLVGNLSGEVGQVLGAAGRVVGLDTVRLGGIDESALRSDPAAIATATDPTTRLTFSKSLGTRLDVTLSQSLRRGDGQTWLVEYLPTRHLLARLVSNDEGLRSYEVRHDVQFGASRRTNQPSPLAAAQRGPRLRVGSVTVTGAPPEFAGRRILVLRLGSTFSFDGVQEDRDRLERFYRSSGYLTARVGTRQRPRDQFIDVDFVVQAGTLARVATRGTPLPSYVVVQVEQLWADSVAGPLLIDEVRAFVAAHLNEQGYFRARVEVSLAEIEGVQTLTITTERGIRTDEVSVEIDGVDEGLSADLGRLLVTERLVARAPSDPEAIGGAVSRGLRERGYNDARVRVDVPLFEDNTARVKVVVVIGAALRVGVVSLAGSTLSADLVQSRTGLVRDMPFDPAAVEVVRSRMESLYREEGFASAIITLRTRPNPGGAVDVAIGVNEGPRQTISDVRVVGLRGIAQDVAERAMGLERGQPARAADLLRARTALLTTGLFRRVDVAGEPDTERRQVPGQAPLRVVATVEEWPAVRLRYGLQVAEERAQSDGRRRELVPGLSADATRRTLFGRAIGVGGAAVLQQRTRLGRVFATAPTLMALPVRSSLVVQKAREEFAGDNVSDTTSISWEQRTRVLGRLELSYTYRFERVHSFVTGPENPNLPSFDISLNIARLTAAAAWDSRDDPAAPARGVLLTSTLEHAPDRLGSQIRFVRYFAQARHFRSWRGIVLASAAQYGIVTSLGGQEVIPSERFYTGGATTIRGLGHDAAGVTDAFGPVGGRVLMLFNQEARIPIRPWLQTVAFVDTGNVFVSPTEVRMKGLAASVGFGVRVVTPFALLRVDHGRLVSDGGVAQDDRGRWAFGIGHAF